jgi:hypothetical protein
MSVVRGRPRILAASVCDPRAKIEARRIDYKHHRPHDSLGYRTPAEFVRQRHTTWANVKRLPAQAENCVEKGPTSLGREAYEASAL